MSVTMCSHAPTPLRRCVVKAPRRTTTTPATYRLTPPMRVLEPLGAGEEGVHEEPTSGDREPDHEIKEQGIDDQARDAAGLFPQSGTERDTVAPTVGASSQTTRA